MRTAGAGGAVEQGRPLSAGPRRSSTLGTVVFWASLGISLVLTLSFVVGALAPLVPFLVFLPAIVATVGTLQQTAVIAGWTYLVAFMVYASRDGISGQELYGLVLAAVLAVLSIAASWYRIRSAEEEYRRRSHEEEVRQLRSTVAELQRRILRPLPARVSGLIVDGHYRPVEENQMVGGDIYEVVRTPFGVRVMIADVQGKGLPAVGTAFSVLGAFRSAAYHIKDLIQLADVLDTSVVRYNIYAKQVQEPERFVTALLLDIDDQGRVRVINCGHLPPYVVCPQYAGPAVPHDPSAPLGLGSLVPQARVIQEFSLPPEATLLLCTDGVTEARNRDGKFYPLKERLRGWRNVPAEQLIERIAADLGEFTEEDYRDDMTVLTLYRERSAAPVAEPPRQAAR